MNGWAVFLVVGGAILQLGGLGLTVWQIRLVIGIRSAVWEQACAARDRVLRRKTATVHVPPIRLDLVGTGTARVDLVVVGESDVDRLDRITKRHDRALEELDRKLAELGRRTQWALEDRLDELDRETTEKAKTNAVLMWWGVVLIAAGILAQTVGGLL
ncbi:MAG: hypothetical protein GXY65_00250 [Rhodococcus sp.]|uniref:hypothetical protein n=1 Tax=Rhodococcus sp. TaxID=1831 RepID=UPI0016BAF0DC|nr:hypothetical protein [Rhodococcus sp. (in: high G+C Gram-positive bacteria)]NLV77781.1 hypothetical protein [Rhodococcus sp. (in: high G+C Gram-positive bacteria)]